jgi:hypothetical protein
MRVASKVWGDTWELTLYGSSGHHMGARCSHMGGGWCHVGAACTIWEPHVPYGSQMGAMCSRWEADGARWEMHVLYGSRMNCMGPAYPMGDRWHNLGAAWPVWGPYESCVHHMVAMCTSWLAPIWCHLPPLECHLAPIWRARLKHGAYVSHSSIWPPHGMHHQYGTIPICWHLAPMLLSKNAHGSHAVHMAPIRCTWHPNGACGSLCIIWEPCGGNMATLYTHVGGVVCEIKAVCTIQELRVVIWEVYGIVWKPDAPDWSRVIQLGRMWCCMEANAIW